MRTAFLFLIVFQLATAAAADDPADRVRKTRVALALSANPEVVGDGRTARVAAFLDLAGESCGACRSDLEACRLDAKRLGKVLVVFVGGCESRGLLVAAAGAIPCRAGAFPDAGPVAPSPARRIVVLYPRNESLYVSATLPPAATPGELLAEVRRAEEARDRK